MLRSLLSLVLTLVCIPSALARQPAALAADQATSAGPHNLILIIGDGMPLASEIAASRYLTGADHELAFQQFPYTSCCSTWDVTTYDRYAYAAGRPRYSGEVDWALGYDPAQGGPAPYPGADADSYLLTKLPRFARSRSTAKEPATDSAAAASALATGVKTDEGNISWAPGDPEDGALPTIFEQFRAQSGGAIGVVTTVPFCHATPAAFISHNRDRENYLAISHEILTRTRPEVVIGAGHPRWNKQYLSELDLAALRRSPEYVLAEREAGADGGARLSAAADAALAQDKKLFGLFGGKGGAFELPEPSGAPGAPAFTQGREDPQLDEAARAALRVLGQDPDGFALLIEQGTIDGANHGSDFAAMIGAVYDLNRTVEAVLDYIALPGDNITQANTVVIVTADHANGHLRLRQRLGQDDLPRQEKTPSALRGYAKPQAAAEPAPNGFMPVYYGRYMYPDGEVAYSTGNHTNELVSLYAWGDAAVALLTPYEGAHYPGTRIIDNTDVNSAAVAWLLPPQP
jgi:alkaline phosphatase